MNYILTPEVTALITNFRNYANGNKDATELVLPAIRDDEGIYPSPEGYGKTRGDASFHRRRESSVGRGLHRGYLWLAT